MWIADGWKDYELLDCGGGEKLERWGRQILVRPDPQAIWAADRTNPLWRTADARYSRSSTGGGHWDRKQVPESWSIRYGELTFQGLEWGSDSKTAYKKLQDIGFVDPENQRTP